jgi:hypothetical protein
MGISEPIGILLKVENANRSGISREENRRDFIKNGLGPN